MTLFLNCESTCDLTDVAASMYDRKTVTQPFDTFNDVLRCPSVKKQVLWKVINLILRDLTLHYLKNYLSPKTII